MFSSLRNSLKLIWVAAVIGGLWCPAGRAATPKVWLFADTNAFQALQPELNQWKADVNAEGRYEAEIYALPPMSPVILRLMLQLGYQNNNLAGVLLVGKTPYVMTELTATLDYSTEPYPTDAYFTDFDCEWSDVDNNGWKDIFGVTGGLVPDIWLGRIDCEMLQYPGKSRIDLLRSYFQKIHKYRTGTLSLPKDALLYQALNSHVTSNDFGNVYSSLHLIQPAQATGSNYLQIISSLPGHEFVYLDCHSYKTVHETPSTWVKSDEIHAANPKGLFFFLDTCFAGSFNSSNYIAGNYLFDSTYGLLALGTTYFSGYPFPAGYQSLSSSAGQDWGTIMLQFARNTHGWQTTYVMLGDPTLVPHFNPPAFEIHRPYAFTAEAPLKIIRPSGTTAQMCRIPVNVRLTTGAGDALTLIAKNLPAGVTAGSNSFFAVVRNAECHAEIQLSVSPTAALGKREIILEAADARGNTATTTCWIEIMAPPANKPDFSIAFDAPTNVLVFYFGQNEDWQWHGATARLTTANLSTPVLLNLNPVNWPDGFKMITQQEAEAWPCIALLSQKDSPVALPLRVAVSPTTPVGSYSLAVSATCMGVEKTISLRVQILPPYPDVTTDPALPQLVPGDEGRVDFTKSSRGFGHISYAIPALPGFSISKLWSKDLPVLASGTLSYYVTTDWSVTPGIYPLMQCKWQDNPAVPAKNTVLVEMLPQYSMSLDQFSGTALGGVLKLTIKNQALNNPPYKLNLSMVCPDGVTANLSPVQVTVPSTRYGITEAFVYFTTQINVASLLGRPYRFSITLNAQSPDYPWPAQSATATFEVPQIPYIPQQYSLIPILFIPTPGPSPVYLSNLYRTTQVLTPVTTQVRGTIGR